MNRLFKGSAEIKVDDLATLIASLSRLTTRLSNMNVFRDSGLGIAEWSTLSAIIDRRNINSRQLANIIGVSVQRINQITASLKSAQLIQFEQDPDDARKKMITVTSAGRSVLNDIEVKLLPVIVESFGQRPLALKRTKRMINWLLLHLASDSWRRTTTSDVDNRRKTRRGRPPTTK